MNVCLATTHLLWNTTLGGHAWVFLNWALGLQAAGCRVTLLEALGRDVDADTFRARMVAVHGRLAGLGLDARIAFALTDDQRTRLHGVHQELAGILAPLDQVARDCELLLNFRYSLPQDVVSQFARTGLVDIDPGLLQVWVSEGQIRLADHDVYFTIGETVGRPDALFPDCGIEWHYTPPPVHLPSWPLVPPPAAGAAFTTVTNWWGKYEWVGGQTFNNEKRTHFVEYIDLPARTTAALALAIYHEEGHPSEIPMMCAHGWRARPASEVAGSPEQYRQYLQSAQGEFSCAKPSCMRFQNGWISDRTICFLASGRPAIVQHTGPSRFLPDAEGLFRFHTIDEAVDCLSRVQADHGRQCRRARELAVAHFSAEAVVGSVVERAMAAQPRVRRQR